MSSEPAGIGAGVARPAPRDLLTAAGVGAGAAAALAWQLLRLPAGVGQFSKYPNAALQVLYGSPPAERLLDFSPLYLGLHLAAFRFLPQPLAWLAGAQIAFLALAAALLFLALRRHVGAGVALAGAAAFALGTSTAIYGHVFEPEALLALLLVALVFVAGRDGLPAAATAGVLVALCALTRPSFAPLAAVLPLHLWLRRAGRRRFAAALLAFSLPVLAGAGFVAARNQRLLGAPSLLVMNPGTVFFDCNSPLAAGGGAYYPPVVEEFVDLHPGESDYHHVAFREIARLVEGPGLSAGGANRYWWGKAAAFVADEPGRFARLVARRALHLFHAYRWNDLRTEWAAGEALAADGFPSVPFAPVAALALVGLGVALAAPRVHLVPLAVFLVQGAVMTLAYATDRQRACLAPFFAYFAALALAWLAGGRRRRLAAVALVPLALALAHETGLMRDNRRTWEGRARLGPLLAEAARRRDDGDFAAAKTAAAGALAATPWAAEQVRPARLPLGAGELARLALSGPAAPAGDDARARFDRALLLEDAGALDEADALLAQLHAEGAVFETLLGRPAEPAYHRARIAIARDRRDEAAGLLREALQRSPGDPASLAALACLTGDAAHAARVQRYFDDLDAAYYLGRACLATGWGERAVESFEYLAARLPESRLAQRLLARALAAAGRHEEAARTWVAAAGGPGDRVVPVEELLPSFAAWAADGPPAATYWQGVVLRELGRFPESLAALERAAAAGVPAAGPDLAALRALLGRAAEQRQPAMVYPKNL